MKTDINQSFEPGHYIIVDELTGSGPNMWWLVPACGKPEPTELERLERKSREDRLKRITSGT